MRSCDSERGLLPSRWKSHYATGTKSRRSVPGTGGGEGGELGAMLLVSWSVLGLGEGGGTSGIRGLADRSAKLVVGAGTSEV